MPKALLLAVLVCCMVFSTVQAQEVADVLPQNTIFYAYGKDFNRLYGSYSRLAFGSRGAEVENKLKGILKKVVDSQNLAAAGFSQEFIERTVTSIDGLHFAFLGMGPGMPNLFLALKISDEAHYASILRNPQMLGGMVQAGEYSGVAIYSTQMPVPVDITIYKGHLILTNQPGLVNQIIDGQFKLASSLSNNPKYSKFVGMQRPGHFLTMFVDISAALSLMGQMGVTNDPEYQVANSILELDKLHALGLQASMTDSSSSFALHLTMDPNHSFYNAIRVEPAARHIAEVLPSRVLFSTSTSLGDATNYLNRVINFANDAVAKTGGPPVKAQLQMMEQQFGFTLNELVSHVGTEASFFALPIDNLDINNFNPVMLADRFGFAFAIRNEANAKAFADKLFSSPVVAQGLDPNNWKNEDYNGVTIRSNVPPGMPAGLNYGFVNHPARGTFLIAAPTATAIKKCVDAVKSGNSLASSRGYQVAYELMDVTSSREFFMDVSSVMALLKSMPEMAPFAGMLESAGSSEVQQFAVVSVEKAGAFSILNVTKQVPQDMTDVFLEQLNMLEMMIPGGAGGAPFSRPTKEEK